MMQHIKQIETKGEINGVHNFNTLRGNGDCFRLHDSRHVQKLKQIRLKGEMKCRQTSIKNVRAKDNGTMWY
jgi:hypothetical protein